MRRFTCAAALILLATGLAAAEERIQLAILLDTSNSMDGLIGQAKSQLWSVVNELARSRRNGRVPTLEVALFEYGNNALPVQDGYVRLVSDLTTDLDRISQELFGLDTNGGDEYCGVVIDRAVKNLSWSNARDALKIVYIAGNESFTQGDLQYQRACAAAAARGIIVNTIYCGGREEGIATAWKDGADRADGRYMNIDQDQAVAQIATPYDDEIVRLGTELNKTYLAYGGSGEEMKTRQEAQDANAAVMGTGTSVNRTVTKAQSVYENSGWDLVDAVRDKQIVLAALKDTELPAEMREMTTAQREKYVQELAARRAELQGQINSANEKRRLFMEAEMKRQPEQNTLERAMRESVKEQAKEKGYTMN